MKQLVLNRIQTPDGTILTSYYRHNYVDHTDKNGQYYAVDGGIDYAKRAYDKPDYKELSIYSDDPFEIVRESLHRGTHGKDGNEKFHYILLKDMTDEHLQNCIEYEEQRDNKRFLNLYKQEVEYRKQNNITINKEE